MSKTLSMPSGGRLPVAGRLRRPFGGRVALEVARSIVEQVFLWQDRIRQRMQLAELDDRLLRDIGLTRADVARELDKPFWQA